MERLREILIIHICNIGPLIKKRLITNKERGKQHKRKMFFEKDTSLTIININKETKLNVHEGYTKSNRGREDQQAHLGISTRLTSP